MQEFESEKSSRGGYRAGAGRKSKAASEKNVPVSFSLPPELAAQLRTVPDKSRLVQSLLRRYFESL